MSAADRLIGEFRGGAALDAEGEFSLDGAEARRKLRAFQVADPRAYLLFLVQAAHFRGATSVAITRSLTSATVVFAGAPLSREDVDDLYSAVFRGARDRLERSRQCLGLGVNAALGLGASARARIQGGPAEDRFVAQLRGEDVDYRPGEPTSRTWTDVTIKGLPFALRFGEREVELLLRGAAVSPLEVTVNGEALNPAWVAGGFDGIAGLLLSGVVVRGAGGTVIAGFARADYPLDRAVGGGRRSPGSGCVDLIVGGVWLERLELKHLPEEMRLIAYCDALRTDLSLTKVVRDEALQALLRVVDVAAGRALRAAFDGPWSLRPPDLEQATRRFLLGWRGSLREAAVKDPQIAALAERVTWPRLDGGVRTAAELLREAGPVPYVHPIGEREPAIDLVPGLGAAVIVDDAGAFELLRELAGGREHAVDFAVRLGDQRRYNLERWRARPYQPRTGATHSHIVAITGPEGDAGSGVEVGGEVGLSRRGGPSTVDIVVDGACIATLPLDLPLSGIGASLCGDFTPRPSFDGVYVDRRFAAGVVALLGAVDRIVRRLLEAASVGGAWAGSAAYASERLGYLELLCHADVREGVLRAFGLDAELCAAAERGELGELPRLRVDDLRHPLATYAAFPTVRDAQLSLQEIAALARTQGHIDVIAEGHLGLSERAQPLCLRIDRRRRAVLAALFGEAALRDASGLPEWVREGGRIPRRAVDPLAGVELRIAAAADGIAVGVGLAPAGADGRGGLFVVHKEGFEVARERLELGLVISATDDRATIDRFSLELLPSPRTDALLDRVGEAVDRLVSAAIDAVTARDGEEASVEVRSRGAALLLDLLRAVYRVPARIQEHIRLLRRGVPRDQVAALLGDRSVSDGALRLPHYRRYRQGIIERIDARMGRRLGELIAVPLFPTIAGATLSLAALVAAAARRRGTFRYALAPPGCVRDPVAAGVLAARSDEVERLLEPLFGAEALREVSLASLRAEARREAKTRRRALPPAPAPRPRSAPSSPELRAVIETIERVEIVELVADTAGVEAIASVASVDGAEVLGRGDRPARRDLFASASVADVADVEQLEAIAVIAEVELEIDGEARLVDDADVEVLSLLEVEEVDDEAELIDGLHAWLEASEPAPTKRAPPSPPPAAASVAEATADAPVDDALCSAALPGGVGRIWLAASVVEHLELRGGGIVEGASLPGILELSGEGAIDEGALLAVHVGLHRALVAAVRGGDGEPTAVGRRARAYLLEIALRHRGRPLPELAELGLDRLVAELEEAPLVASEGGWISVAEAIRERAPEVLARLDEIAPPAPNRTPAARLFDALCAEVRAVRAADDALILETWLAGLVLADGGRRSAAVGAAGGRLQLHRRHPLVTAALASASEGPPEPTLVALLASAIVTAVRLASPELDGERELEFHARHARRLADAAAG